MMDRTVAFLPDHRWEPWACQLHGFISASYEMCPDCERELIQMGERIADQWAEEEAQERRAFMRRGT